MVAADLDRVMELEHVLFGAGAWSRAGYEDELRAPGRHYVVLDAADEGSSAEVVGYAGALLDVESHVMTLGVAPEHRRRGHARTLLAHLLDAARARTSSSMLLEVRADDVGAQALYRAAGFVPIGVRPGYYQLEGVDAVVMRVDLTA